HRGALSWNALQLGNNGGNYIIAGRTATGASLTFIVNNTSDYEYGVTPPNGTTAMTISNSGIVTADQQLRTPLMYDSNNTSYYVDPSSTSRFNQVRWVDGTTSGTGMCLSTGSGTYFPAICSSLRKYKEN